MTTAEKIKVSYGVNECLKNHFDGLHKYRVRHIVELDAKHEVCIFCGTKKV